MSDSNANTIFGPKIEKLVFMMVGALITFVVMILHSYYTQKSPDLVYEEFEVARFAGEQEQIGIYSARVENIGNFEAENVQVSLELPYKCHYVNDIEVKPNIKSIPYEKIRLSNEQGYEVRIPRLNPNENCYFSIYSKLGTCEIEPFLDIQVRAKGITGHPKEKTENLSFLPLFMAGSLGAAFALVSMYYIIRVYAQKMLATVHELQKNVEKKST